MSMLKESLERLFEKNTASLQEYQKRAWDEAWKIGTPDRKREGFRYMTSLKELYEQKVDEATDTASGTHVEDYKAYALLDETPLIFLNGAYRKEGAPSKLKGSKGDALLLPMDEALVSYGAFLEGRREKRLAKEKDFFALLNTAMQREGLFIYVPPGSKIELPLEILSVLQGQGVHAASLIQIVVGKGAEVTLLQRQILLDGEDHFSNGAVDITVEEGGKCTYIDLTPHQGRQWHFHKLSASLKRDSKLDAYFISGGAVSLRQDIAVELLGSGSEVRLFGAAHVKGDAELHNHILIEHLAPGALSRQHFKAALYDKARSSFEGKIYVEREAQQTLAYQLNNNLILSKEASAFSKPNLEIFADDVKASHGATTAELSEEESFYMRTRGLSKEMSQKYLAYGFVDVLVKDIPYPEIVAEARKIYAI